MKAPIFAFLAAVAVGGCATPAAPPAGGTAQCQADPAQSLVGQPATAANAELARQRAGAEVVRVLQPGQMVTMEFREGRLNVYAKADGTIERITCG